MAIPRSAAAGSALRGELVEIIASTPPVPPPQGSDTPSPSRCPLSVRCVLFDVYGTLFASASGDVGTSQAASDDAAFAATFERMGFVLRDETAPSRARERYFAEIRDRHAAARQRGVDFPEVDIASVWSAVLHSLSEDGLLSPTAVNERVAMCAAAWYEVISNPVAPMPNIVSTIDALTSAGMVLGIVSNAQFYTPLLFPALLGVELAAMGFHEDLCIWSYEVGRAKPSVEMFRIVLKRLSTRYDVSPESVLYLGNDMLNDVWTARSAGCRTGLFAGDRRSLRMRREDPRCADLTPDIIVSRLDDLVDVLAPIRRDKESYA